MPINKNLSDLPSGRSEAGDPPRKPRVVTAVAEAWYEEWQQRDEFGWGPVMPEAGPYRGSYASKRCDRQLEYAFRGITEEIDIAGIYRMALGTMVHDVFQGVMARLFPEDQVEAPLDLNIIGIPGSMRVDLIHYMRPDPDSDHEWFIPIELKTINGFGFKQAATTFKGPPTGPRSGHRLQLAFAVAALGAPYGILGYLSLENIGPELVKSLYDDPSPVQQFAAEWAVSREEADELVTNEAARIARILKFIEDHPDEHVPRELNDPDYPVGALVNNPMTGNWVTLNPEGKPTQTGKTWFCNYCELRPTCIEHGAGYVADTPVDLFAPQRELTDSEEAAEQATWD